MPDPLVWLTYVGAKTNTIKLGTGIVILPLRNPIEVAKATGSVAYFSNDRVVLGAGAGWMKTMTEELKHGPGVTLQVGHGPVSGRPTAQGPEGGAIAPLGPDGS